MLISAGADVTAKTRDDKSIFDVADEVKDEEIIKMISVLKPTEKEKAN